MPYIRKNTIYAKGNLFTQVSNLTIPSFKGSVIDPSFFTHSLFSFY